ncbi:MAG: hypothetical protein IJS61_05805 [Firmicutes bacterium]|nr:hypothetical protein [Bacillota bacterium]
MQKKNEGERLFLFDFVAPLKTLYTVILLISVLILLFSVFCCSRKNKNVAYIDESVYDSLLESEYIYYGVYVNNYPLGGLTKQQALTYAEQKVDDLKNKSLTLFYGPEGNEKTYSYKALGAAYDMSALTEDAYKYARGDNKSENLKAVKDLYAKGNFIDLNIYYNYSREELENAMEDAKKYFDPIVKAYQASSMDAEKTADMLENLIKIKPSEDYDRIYIVTKD